MLYDAHRSAVPEYDGETRAEVIKNRLQRSFDVVEPLLSGIVLGLIPITLAGLFVAAYLQYKRGNELGL